MTTAEKKSDGKWSRKVTDRSDALDLEQGVFSKSSPNEIATSLKQSAERSQRRKSSPFRSAMSMLNFYINRAGAKMSATKRKQLDVAKKDLRKDFGRPGSSQKSAKPEGRDASKGAGRAQKKTRV